jgi:hypothetical protein
MAYCGDASTRTRRRSATSAYSPADDRRPRLLGERRSLHPGRGENECSGGSVHAVAVELEHCVASQHEEELLVCGGVALVVLVDDEVALGTRCPGGNTERRDAEMVSDRPVVAGLVR